MKLIYKTIEIDRELIWSVEEIKNYLRISHDYDDALITSLSEAAIEYAENFTGEFINKRKISCFVSGANKIIRLNPTYNINLISVHKVIKEDKENISDSFGDFNIQNFSMSLSELYINQDIEILYNCGFAGAVPKALKLGMLKHISAMYELNESALDPVDEIRNLYLPYRKLKI